MAINPMFGSGGMFAGQATDAELATHEADTTSIHGITDTAQVVLKNVNNVFTASPQTMTADADGDTNLNLVHTEVSPAGYFLEMKSDTTTQRLAFGGPNSAIGGWGIRLTGAGTLTLEATNNLLYAAGSEAVKIGSSVNTNAVWIGNGTGITLGFFGTTPIARPSAYAQTYSTATRTHSNPTASSVVTTGAGLASYGYTEAQANAIVVAVNALVVDMANVKQVVNSVIDDGQAYGLLQ